MINQANHKNSSVASLPFTSLFPCKENMYRCSSYILCCCPSIKYFLRASFHSPIDSRRISLSCQEQLILEHSGVIVSLVPHQHLIQHSTSLRSCPSSAMLSVGSCSGYVWMKTLSLLFFHSDGMFEHLTMTSNLFSLSLFLRADHRLSAFCFFLCIAAEACCCSASSALRFPLHL